LTLDQIGSNLFEGHKHSQAKASLYRSKCTPC